MEKINEIVEIDGRKVVMINNKRVTPRKGFEWSEIKKELKKYVGKSYIVECSKDLIKIGADFSNEYCHSKDTYHLKGSGRRTKAQIINAIPQLIKASYNKRYSKDYKDKHGNKAKLGWVYFDVDFLIPVISESGTKSERTYIAKILIRLNKNNQLYLYDIVRIQKRGVRPALDDCVKR